MSFGMDSFGIKIKHMKARIQRAVHKAIMKRAPRRQFDPDTGRKISKSGRRGAVSRRIIQTVILGGYVHSYHATKGWRVNKL
jgi:hypothetical protein